MESFFTKKETQSKSRKGGRTLSCASCGLYQLSDNPRLTVQGKGREGILIVATSSSKEEDKAGTLWRGLSGRYLKAVLNKFNIDLQEDCYVLNAVRCYAESPVHHQIDCCRRKVHAAIKEIKPEVIITLGHHALYSLFGEIDNWDFSSLKKWVGQKIPHHELKTIVCPTIHPKDIESDFDKYIFSKHIEEALSAEYFPNPEFTLERIEDLSPLSKIPEGSTISFDFETTGIKPYAKGHRIVCAAVATSPNHAYTFLIPKTRNELQPFLDLLANPKIKKMAHNMKFEDTWTKKRLHTTVYGWDFDTMLGAHIIDNQSGICGLKFQTFVNFGIGDYDSHLSPYLKSKDADHSNAFNKVQQLMESPNLVEQLIEYCGQDTIYQWWLADKQKDILEKSNLWDAYNLLHNGTLALARAERNGLRIDTTYLENESASLDEKINALEKEFYSTKFYRHWSHIKANKPNIYSNQQLANYLYKGRKIKPAMTSEAGQGSTSEEALKALKIPELDALLQLRKLKKLKTTYVDSFQKEQVRGYMHPVFHLHTVTTYRSSSSDPNFQNIPKRDKEANRIVRSGVFPRPGHQLVEIDFSGIEVSIAACYHKDPTMLEYLRNKVDFHGILAEQIFEIPNFNKSVHKKLRYAAKNGFVFPQFYGDYYRNNAVGLCVNCDLPTQGTFKGDQGVMMGDIHIGEHLQKIGLGNFEKFVSHIQKIEQDFWGNRFKVYGRWKKQWANQYRKLWEIRSLSGFRFLPPIGKNEILNYPVQGAAFHCLLWSFIELDKYLTENKMDSRLIGQIHDAAVFDAHPDELSDLLTDAKRITTKDLTEAWDWIIVPLDIEAEVAPIDASWYEVEEYKI